MPRAIFPSNTDLQFMLHIKQNRYPGLRCEPRGRDIVEKHHCGGVSCTVNSESTSYRVRFHSNILALVSSMEGISREHRFSRADEVAGAGREVVPGDNVARFGSRTRGRRRAKLRCYTTGRVHAIVLEIGDFRNQLPPRRNAHSLSLLHDTMKRIRNVMLSDFWARTLSGQRELNVCKCRSSTRPLRVAEIPAESAE